MFVPFAFTAGSSDGGSRVTVRGGAGSPRAFDGARDVVALSFSDDGDVSGDVVFAGYGIVVPESQTFGYDSYAGLDVKDKVVLVLRYFPEDADQATRAILARYSDLRYKALAARQRGARAILVVTGPASPNAGTTIPMTFDTALAGSGISAASISARVAQAILGDRSLQELQKALDGGNPHVAGRGHRQRGAAEDRRRPPEARRPQRRRLPAGDRARWPASIVRGWRSARTTITWGAAPAATPWPVANRPARRTSAPTTTPRARPRYCWRPRSCRSGRGRATCLIGLWSAEEIGLIGSAAFLASGGVAAKDLAAYLNFDMVGRMVDNRLAVQATGTSPHVGVPARAGQRRGRLRPRAAARSVSADRRRQLQPGRRAQPVVHHRRPRRLPQAVGHRRQDQLRGPGAHRADGVGDRRPA